MGQNISEMTDATSERSCLQSAHSILIYYVFLQPYKTLKPACRPHPPVCFHQTPSRATPEPMSLFSFCLKLIWSAPCEIDQLITVSMVWCSGNHGNTAALGWECVMMPNKTHGLEIKMKTESSVSQTRQQTEPDDTEGFLGKSLLLSRKSWKH